MDFKMRPEYRYKIPVVVSAYDARDAYDQVDCLIDKTVQSMDVRILMVEPFPLSFKEKLLSLLGRGEPITGNAGVQPANT